MDQIPQEIQHQLAQLQQVQAQAQAMSGQKGQMEAQLREADKALEELGKLDSDAEVYKSVGSLLVRSDKDKVEADLKEQKETLVMRVDRMKKQEEKIHARLKELQETLQAKLGQGQGGAPSAG